VNHQTTPDLARPPYTYTDAQDHRLALMTTSDAHGRPYVWVEAEDLAIGGDVTSVWLTIEQAALLDDALAGGVSASFTDHTGDYLATGPGDPHTVITVTRSRDEDDDPAEVRVVLLTARVPEVRAALAATAERAQQRVAAQPEAPVEPAAPAVGQRYTSRTDPARTVTVTRVWGTAVAFDWRDDKPGQCGSACPLDVFNRAYEPEQPAEPTVTVTVKQVEAALRGYLAILDYDLHKNLECGEETGEDTYTEEAADLFDRLRDAEGGEQA
jgi:hypothetical protein